MAGPIASLAPGTIFHRRYEVVRCIKTGGMGAVYEVTHLETQRRCALKVMLPGAVANADLRDRFKLEATATARVRSEHIVDTFDAGVDEETGTPFLVMELLEGEDLGAHLARRGRLPSEEVVLLLRQVALALDKTHAAQIVHRDLKPENLFLTARDDGTPHVKVLDFGIAKLLAGHEGTMTEALGTPAYMAPEQMRGHASLGGASDTYSLAYVAYRLLVGEGFWDAERRALGSSLALMLKISIGPPELATRRAARAGVTLPAAFDPWFARATAPKPEERFQRASTMVAALAEALDVQRSVGPPRGDAPSVTAPVTTPSFDPDPALRAIPAVTGAATVPVTAELGELAASQTRPSPAAAAPLAGARKMRRRAILAGASALVVAGGGWVALGYVSNDAQADENDRTIARAARFAWRAPGGTLAKLDLLDALHARQVAHTSLGDRLLYLPFLGLLDADAVLVAYANGFREGFVRPAMKLIEERLASSTQRADFKADALQVYTSLGSGQFADSNWLLTRLRAFVVEVIRRDDPALPTGEAEDRSLRNRLLPHVTAYVGWLRDRKIPTEKVDAGLVERTRAAINRH